MFKLSYLFHKHEKVITYKQVVSRSDTVTTYLVNGYCSKCNKHLYWVEKERNEIILH